MLALLIFGTATGSAAPLLLWREKNCLFQPELRVLTYPSSFPKNFPIPEVRVLHPPLVHGDFDDGQTAFRHSFH